MSSPMNWSMRRFDLLRPAKLHPIFLPAGMIATSLFIGAVFGAEFGATVGVISLIGSYLFFPVYVAMRPYHRATVGQVRVGRDGVVVQQAQDTRFVSYALIQDVEMADSMDAVYIALRNGSGVHVQVSEAYEFVQEVLAKRDAFRRLPKVRVADAYARRGEDIETWTARVRSLGSSLRNAGLEPDSLAAIAENASAPAEQRVAAALVLRNAGPLRVRVETAAQETVHPALAKAMLAALDDRLSDEMLMELSDT